MSLGPFVANHKTITDSMMRSFFDTPREYLTREELAQMLQVSLRTIDRWVCLKRVPYTKLGKYRGGPVRFKRTDIVAWLQEQRSYGT